MPAWWPLSQRDFAEWMVFGQGNNTGAHDGGERTDRGEGTANRQLTNGRAVVRVPAM
jgi:hypothetical protein